MKTPMYVVFLALFFSVFSPANAGGFRFSNAVGNVVGKAVKDVEKGSIAALPKTLVQSALPPNCTPPLRYVGNGEFYCANGDGPFKLSTSGTVTRAEVVEKLKDEKLIVEALKPTPAK